MGKKGSKHIGVDVVIKEPERVEKITDKITAATEAYTREIQGHIKAAIESRDVAAREHHIRDAVGKGTVVATLEWTLALIESTK